MEIIIGLYLRNEIEKRWSEEGRHELRSSEELGSYDQINGFTRIRTSVWLNPFERKFMTELLSRLWFNIT